MIFRLLALLICCTGPLFASECREAEYEGNRYALCEVDLQTRDLRLFLNDSSGEKFGDFTSVNAELKQKGQKLGFAMNAGMYHDDRRAVGLFINDQGQQQSLMTREGPGNFGLLPNGVFCNGDSLWVYETRDYLAQEPFSADATQSGPMLVIDGALHPRFIAGGTSKFIRNGVGTSEDGGHAYFAISNEPVNFHDFATLFRDRMNVPNALYFDGGVSRLYAPAIDRSDFGWQLGPIVGVLAPQ